MKAFYHLLGNTLFVSVINATVWFAITFYAYLQTQSVMVTGIIGGIYLVATAISGFWFGSLVDNFRKKKVIAIATAFSLLTYLISFYIYVSTPQTEFANPASPMLWLLIVPLMLGVVAGNIRNIAIPTLVTLLVPEDDRAKANGLVGTITGTAFMVTSAISGILVGLSGMYWALLLAIIVSILSIIDLSFINIVEKEVVHVEGQTPIKNGVDIKGTLAVIGAIPGLFALIIFSTFNNFLGGAFMALLDAYGLSMVSVEIWGILLAVLSTGFIVGGMIIAKRGLGSNPLRTMLMVNVIMWITASLFTIQPWLPLLIGGMFIYMILIPFAEASEQTLLQKVVPFERQGRVFGFAQSVEQSASPVTAFLIGPLTQLVFIPFMTTGSGVELIGDWFGTGQARGIALVFVITGVIGLIATIVALRSKYYVQLSNRYLTAPATQPATDQ